MRNLRWLASVSSITVACSPVMRAPGDGVTPPRPPPVPIERATWRARAAFDSATRAGDTLGMAAVFAADAVLISAAGDSIRGREAITHYLVQLVPEAVSVGFRFAREGSFELCSGSGRERVLYTAQINHASRAPDAVSGSLSVFWKRDSTGALRISWVALSAREVKRRLRPSECRTPEDSIARAWRVAFSLFLVPAGASTESKGSFEGTLRTRGWVDLACACVTSNPVYTPLSDGTERRVPGLVSVQYRLRRHVLAEVLGGRIPEGTTMGARFYSNRDYAQTRLRYSGTLVGVLLSYERWGFQLGIGPATQSAHWSLRDSLVPFSTGGNPEMTDISWSKWPVGMIGDGRFQRFISGRLFLVVRAQVRRFPMARTPGTPRFPPALVDQGSSFVGVGLGAVL